MFPTMSRPPRYLGVLTLVFIAVVLKDASAEMVTTIRDNGSAANRVDIVILGDGYTAAELGKYAADVESFVGGLFAQDPYAEYRQYFNVHRVDVVSSESGSDHPDRTPAVFKNTALDSTYNCAGIQRLICVSASKVNSVLASSVMPAMRDVVLVIVNDTEYGGSGGSIAVASIHPAVVELVLHELGHTLGLLADEYSGGGPACSASLEPPEANATKQTTRGLIKWGLWIDASTPVPTPGATAGVPGLYEGAKYCFTELFRPTFDSKMRTLSRPFDQVNTEQLVKRIYNWASPIDATEPLDATITLGRSHSQTFLVRTPQPFTHGLTIMWTVDGVPSGGGSEFVLDGSSFPVGSHTVAVRVTDATLMVRSDPAAVLSESRSWEIVIFDEGTPNLQIAALKGKPVAGAGMAYSVVDTTKNAGTAIAPPSRTKFYLSPNSTWDAGDILLQPAAGRSLPGLDAGLSSGGTTTVTIPAGATTGKHFLIGYADADSSIAESDETDNTKAKAIYVGPDLTIADLSAPADAARGAVISISDTTSNVGGASVTVTTTTRFYLSLNKKVDGSDIALGAGRNVGVLASGASSSGTTNVTIPAGTAAGTYFVLARADDGGAQAESREGNNAKAKSIVIH